MKPGRSSSSSRQFIINIISYFSSYRLHWLICYLFPLLLLPSAVSSYSFSTFTTATTTATTTTTAMNAAAATSQNNPFDRIVYGKNDALFGCIEEQQGKTNNKKSFGSLLDAGTGLHSLRWIASLVHHDGGGGGDNNKITDFTAITADTTMQRNVQMEAKALEISEYGQVIIGNWFDTKYPLDEELLHSSNNNKKTLLFDTIIADYLIGAMDGFSPYSQDLMIPKLAKLLKSESGSRLYIVGLQPIPDSVPGDDNNPANIICKVRQVRDACILLAGHRCYREYPVDWITRQIENQANCLKVVNVSKFPILYRHETILKQINVARTKLVHFNNPELATSMAKTLDDLEHQSQQATGNNSSGRIQLGFDYVVTAEKVVADNNNNNDENADNDDDTQKQQDAVEVDPK